jgi:hypothetical protein
MSNNECAIQVSTCLTALIDPKVKSADDSAEQFGMHSPSRTPITTTVTAITTN